MKPDALLVKTEELLRQGKYRDTLDVIRGHDLSTVTPDVAAQLHLDHAEASLHIGTYQGLELETAIEYFRCTADHTAFGRAKYLKGWLLQSTASHSEAMETLIEAYTSFRRACNKEWEAQALNRLSLSCVMLGDMNQAVKNLAAAIAIYHNVESELKAVASTINLVAVHLMAGRLRAALAQFHCIESALCEQSPTNIASCLLCMACATALIGESARARQQLRTALSYVGHSQRQTSLYYEYEGWIALLAEDYPTAEQALTEGLHIALKIAPESDLVSQIKRLFGDLYIATGKFSRARKFAREALKVAEKLNERAEIAACYRVFAQVDQNSGKNKSALEWYGKAIDLFNLIGSRYELAVTRYLAGVSDIYTTSERTALLFLAREYFASEEIAHYIEKVDRALKDTAPAVVKRCRQSRDRETDVIVASEVMQKILERIDHLAGSEMAILLTGATGTGKDVFARYIHRLSGRSGEFVPVNMGALSTGIAEAELFGHRKGAFTGAHDNHTGLVERADKGTLFLNEIGEISPALQVTLLDVLENREVRRVGGSKHRPVAFRPIAATNQDMKKLLEDGRFRPDLYHRLSEIEIHLPPLSDRRDDIPPLVTYFLGLLGSTVKTNGTQGDFRRLCGLLSAVDWPGNIRELKSRIGELHNAHKDDYAAMADEVLRWPDESDVDILDRVLTFTDGNRRRAAVLLGVSEGTVRYRKSRGNSRTGDL